MPVEEIQRFDVPVRRQKLINIYRSMRNSFERVAAAEGESDRLHDARRRQRCTAPTA